MPNFTFSPTAGTGSYLGQTIVCTPTARNNSYEDKVTKAVINGVSAVTLTHYGKPCMVYSSGTRPVPAAGGVLEYTMQTHYDFAFYNLPTGVTISDSNGRTYTEEARYPASYSEGAVFYINVPANTATTMQSFAITMRHYYPVVNGVLSSNVYDVQYQQQAGSPAVKHMNVSPTTIVWDWDDDTGKTITVDANVSWTASVVSGHYQIVGSATGTNDGSITIKPTDTNHTSGDRFEATVSFVGEDNLSASVSLVHYRQPRSVLISGEGGETIDPTGGTRHITITSDYEWWFNPNPNYTNQHIKMYTDDNKTTQIMPIPWGSSKALAIATGKTYTFTWEANYANVRNDYMEIYYTKLDGTTGTDGYENYAGFRQSYVVNPQIQVSPSTLIFDWWEGNETTKQFEVTTEMGGDWTFTTNHDLDEFTCVKNGHYLEVTPRSTHSSTSLGSSKRYVNVTFTHSTDQTATVTAKAEQYAHPWVATAPGTNYTIASTGETKNIWISSDYPWWIITNFDTTTDFSTELEGTPVSIVYPAVDGQNPLLPIVSTEYDFVFTNNPSTTQRPPNGTGYFEIRYNDRSGTTRTDGGSCMGWRQDAAQPVQNYIVVDPDYVELPSGRTMGLTFSVSADTSWTASTQQDWIAISRTATAGTAGYTEDLAYAVLQNDTNVDRTGTITVTGGTASDTISIRQSASTVVADSIVVTPTGYTCSSGSSLYNAVSATASSNWTLVKPNWVRWIDSSTFQDTTSGAAGTTKLYINIDANDGSARTGTTTFTCGTASTTYVVQQAEAYVPPEPVGYLELDPAQISPASRNYDIYEVDVYNPTDNDYLIDYGDDWAQFYDGPYPSTADAISIIPNGERLVIYLEVQAGQNRSMTITFTNDEDPSDYITFIVNQP